MSFPTSDRDTERVIKNRELEGLLPRCGSEEHSLFSDVLNECAVRYGGQIVRTTKTSIAPRPSHAFERQTQVVTVQVFKELSKDQTAFPPKIERQVMTIKGSKTLKLFMDLIALQEAPHCTESAIDHLRTWIVECLQSAGAELQNLLPKCGPLFVTRDPFGRVLRFAQSHQITLTRESALHSCAIHRRALGISLEDMTQARQSGLTDAEIAKLIGDATGPELIAEVYRDVRPDHLLAISRQIRLTAHTRDVRRKSPSRCHKRNKK